VKTILLDALLLKAFLGYMSLVAQDTCPELSCSMGRISEVDLEKVKCWHFNKWMSAKTFCQVLSFFAVLLALSVVMVTQMYRTTVVRRELLFRHAADRESDSVFRIFTRHIQNNEALASQFETYSERMFVNSSGIDRRRLHAGAILDDNQGYDEFFNANHQFQHLSLTFRSQLGGIRAYAFAPKVYDDKRDEYETASATLWNHFANRSLIHEEKSWKIAPKTNTNGYAYPVAFIEPHEGFLNAVNFDMSSIRNRKMAFDAGRHSSLSKLTPPIHLVADPEGGLSSLIASPVIGKEDFATAAFMLFNVLNDAISPEFSTPGIKVHLWHMNRTEMEPNCPPGSSRSDPCYSKSSAVTGAHLLSAEKSFEYVTGAAPDANKALEVNGTLVNFAESFLDHEPSYNEKLLVVYQMVVAQREWALVISGSNDFEVTLIPNQVTLIVCLVLINLVASLIYAIFLHHQWKTGRLVRDSEKKAHAKLLGYMCHELRNPVHALQNLTANIIQHSEEEQDIVSLITATVGHMRDLVNGFIDYDKLNNSSTTGMNIEPRAIVVSEIVRDMFHQYKVLAEKDIQMQARIPASLSDTEAHCDPMRLRQILSNALSNASKFVKDGSIVISMYLHDTGKTPGRYSQPSSNSRGPAWFFTCFGCMQNNNITVPVENKMYSNGTMVPEAMSQVLVVEITDSGPGIGGATDGQLFKMYSMLDNNKMKRESNFDAGAGLGLSICKELAFKMGGNVSLANRTDGIRGAVFKLTLPILSHGDSISLDAQEPQDDITIHVAPKEEEEISLNNLKVVVVEDDSVLRRVLKMMLNRTDLKPENVKLLEDGDQIIPFLESDGDENFKPDLIITDIVMKRMNGDEMFDLLRQHDYSVPIVAATGMALEKQKYLDQGFDQVLLKPYALKYLKAILTNYVTPAISSRVSFEMI